MLSRFVALSVALTWKVLVPLQFHMSRASAGSPWPASGLVEPPSRAYRVPLIAMDEGRNTSAWNYAGLRSTGGLFTVVGDELRIYVGGTHLLGAAPYTDRTPAGHRLGIATLRRDGKCSRPLCGFFFSSEQPRRLRRLDGLVRRERGGCHASDSLHGSAQVPLHQRDRQGVCVGAGQRDRLCAARSGERAVLRVAAPRHCTGLDEGRGGLAARSELCTCTGGSLGAGRERVPAPLSAGAGCAAVRLLAERVVDGRVGRLRRGRRAGLCGASRRAVNMCLLYQSACISLHRTTQLRCTSSTAAPR